MAMHGVILLWGAGGRRGAQHMAALVAGRRVLADCAHALVQPDAGACGQVPTLSPGPLQRRRQPAAVRRTQRLGGLGRCRCSRRRLLLLGTCAHRASAAAVFLCAGQAADWNEGF